MLDEDSDFLGAENGAGLSWEHDDDEDDDDDNNINRISITI